MARKGKNERYDDYNYDQDLGDFEFDNLYD